MILLSFSHWGMTPLPDNDNMGNVIIYQDGSFERLELDEPTYMQSLGPMTALSEQPWKFAAKPSQS